MEHGMMRAVARSHSHQHSLPWTSPELRDGVRAVARELLRHATRESGAR